MTVNTDKPVEIKTEKDDAVGSVSSTDSNITTNVTVNGAETVPHVHSWDAGVETTKATCTTDGVKTYTCSAEGCAVGTKTESIPATSHSWGAWTKVDDTNHQRVCANENCPVKTETAAHKFDAGVVTTAPTCTTAGEKTYTCTSCSATETETIAALGHDYDTDGNFDGKDVNGHWYVCNRGCGEKDLIAHTVVVDAAKAPTCLDTGLTEGSHCSDCAYVIVAQKTVDALDHSWGKWTKYDEKTHIRTCANDAAHTKSADHVFGDDSTGTVEAPKGISSMEQTGMSLKIGMDAPDDMSNIDYFSLAFYDSADKAASKMTGITCPKDHLYFYVNRDKFDSGYNYDMVEITAHALNGYEDAVWTNSVSVTHTEASRNITYTYDTSNQPNPMLTINFDRAAYGFYHIGIYNNGQLIANESAYSGTSDSGLVTGRSCNTEEQAAINAGTAQVQLKGWNVAQAELVNGVWTLDIATYDAECSIAKPDDSTSGGSGSGSGSGDATTGSISFVSDGGDGFVAAWTGFSAEKYAYCFRDNQTGERATGYFWTDAGMSESYSLAHQMPRPESGTTAYDFVLYEIVNGSMGNEIARIANALTITVSGSKLGYTIEYNTPSTDWNTVTYTNGAPGGITVLNAWYTADGAQDRCGSNGGNSTTAQLYNPLTDGETLDLRVLTEFAMSTDGSLVATMTPPSTVTYVKPAATNTYGFSTLGDYAVSFHFDFDEPAGFTQIYEYNLQFSEDNGATWTEGVGVVKGESSKHLTDADLEAGAFNAMRMMVIGQKDCQFTEEVWFQGKVDFTVKEETATFNVVFTPLSDGVYEYTFSNINLGDSDCCFYAIEFTDDNTSSGMMRGSGGGCYDIPAGGSFTKTESNSYIADGYFRAALFYNASASDTTAAVTVQNMDGWVKCIPTAVVAE